MPVISAPAMAPRAAPVLRPRLVNAAASPVTASAGDLIVVDASGGNVVINPPASPAGGDAVEITRIDTSSNTVRWTGPVHGDTDGAVLVGLYTGTRLIWTGSTWYVSATNAGAPTPGGIGAMAVETNTAHESFNSGTQTHGNGQDVPVLFNTEKRATPLVTRGSQGTGTKFILNRAGVWVGYATIRHTAASSGESYATIADSNTGQLHGASGATLAATGGGTRSAPINAWLPAGTELYVNAYQSSGGNNVLAAGANWCQFRIAWVHD